MWENALAFSVFMHSFSQTIQMGIYKYVFPPNAVQHTKLLKEQILREGEKDSKQHSR